MNHTAFVDGMGLGLPCAGVRVVIYEHAGAAQQWHTLPRREGESEEALAARAWAVAKTLVTAGRCPASFRLQSVFYAHELDHGDAWHNTRFDLHRTLRLSRDPVLLIDAVRRLNALHDGPEVRLQ